MIVYIESSAAAKLFIDEAESAGLKHHLETLADTGSRPYTSRLTETELRRTAVRGRLPQQAVTEVLTHLRVVEANRTLFQDAGLLPGDELRSLDALHVSAALNLAADLFISYDQRQIRAAEEVGLKVESPA